MARYLGSRTKLSKRVGRNLFLKGVRNYSAKDDYSKRPQKPGVHGGKRGGKQSSLSEYGKQLLEKQILRYTYGLMEKQLSNVIAQRNVYNERVADIAKIQSTLAEISTIDQRIQTLERTTKTLHAEESNLNTLLIHLHQQYRDLKYEKEQLEENIARLNSELKILEDMAGKSVEEQEKASKNLKQKLIESNLIKERLEADVDLF